MMWYDNPKQEDVEAEDDFEIQQSEAENEGRESCTLQEKNEIGETTDYELASAIENGCPYLKDNDSDDESESGKPVAERDQAFTVGSFLEKIADGAQNISGHWSEDGAALASWIFDY